MIEKIYESKEELKKAFDEATKKIDNTTFFIFGRSEALPSLLKAIRDHNIKKLKQSFEESDNFYLGYGNKIPLDGSLGDINYRLTYVVGDEEVTMFDLYNWTEEEVEEVADEISCKDITSTQILYSYFTRKNNMEKAEMVFGKFVAASNERSRGYYYEDRYIVSIESSVSNEYIPVFNYYEKQTENNINKFVLESYIRSIYNTTGYFKNEFNRNFYSRVYKKYRDIIKTIDTSSFFVEDGRMKKKDKAPMINNFDLVESDPVAKDRVFRVFNYEFAKILKDMLRKDSEKTQNIMYDYLNTTHYKGKKRKQFLSTYSRLKDILEEEGLKFDPFRLNEDLQSHVVLDMLN
jgi:hypothetical protein